MLTQKINALNSKIKDNTMSNKEKDHAAEMSAVINLLNLNGCGLLAGNKDIPDEVKIATAKGFMAVKEASSLDNMKEAFTADELTLHTNTKNNIGAVYGADMFSQAMSEIGNSPSKSLSLATMNLQDGHVLEAKYTVVSTDPKSKSRAKKLSLANDIREKAKEIFTAIGLKKLADLYKFKSGTSESKSSTVWNKKFTDPEKGEFNSTISITYRKPSKPSVE